MECKIAEAISPRHYEDGFHSTGTCGVFGGTAACAKLKGLDVVHTSRAFGVAASHAAGLRENFGTMMKPFQAGHATESGVVAADFAAIGWTAAEQILEAQRGFFHAYGGTYDPAAIVDRLGNPWTFQNPGVSIKPFPSGSLTHPGMTELSAPDSCQLHPSRRCGTRRSWHQSQHAEYPAASPSEQPDCRRSSAWSFAWRFFCSTGKRTRRNSRMRSSNRDDVQKMIERVRFYVDPEAEKAGYDKMTTILKITSEGWTHDLRPGGFWQGQPDQPHEL